MCYDRYIPTDHGVCLFVFHFIPSFNKGTVVADLVQGYVVDVCWTWVFLVGTIRVSVIPIWLFLVVLWIIYHKVLCHRRCNDVTVKHNLVIIFG